MEVDNNISLFDDVDVAPFPEAFEYPQGRVFIHLLDHPADASFPKRVTAHDRPQETLIHQLAYEVARATLNCTREALVFLTMYGGRHHEVDPETHAHDVIVGQFSGKDGLNGLLLCDVTSVAILAHITIINEVDTPDQSSGGRNVTVG